jgi:serine O-acetyltransferase
VLEYFRADVARYLNQEGSDRKVMPWTLVWMVLRRQELWIIFLYRYARWVNTRGLWGPLRFALRVPYALVHRPSAALAGIQIPWDADIGKGLFINHFGSIWIGPIVMGEHCNISHEVTIGVGGRGEFRGVPKIGNRVWIGPGAKIFGNIEIGDNVVIGANAVVSKSLPDNAVVVGNPGRIVGYEGSIEFIH